MATWRFFRILTKLASCGSAPANSQPGASGQCPAIAGALPVRDLAVLLANFAPIAGRAAHMKPGGVHPAGSTLPASSFPRSRLKMPKEGVTGRRLTTGWWPWPRRRRAWIRAAPASARAATEGESYRFKEAYNRTEKRARQLRGAKS